MRQHGADAAADDLHDDIGDGGGQIERAAIEHDQAHRGIEMRAGDGREDGDDDEQHRAGGDGVAEQRERLITAGELLGHDAGADHRHDQNQRAERFRREPPRQIELHVPPFLTVMAGLVPAIMD